ncbi:winged helix-turn-helix transcriptional regulator [Candidatus Fermentibacteria bacterium]|nr:winged helix-turn-helix transcriptional regulator [Candidatus Fermentibacteria bacterium]
MDIFELHADLCAVFSDAKRLRIMWFLGDEERSVGEIAESLGVTMQIASQHLRVMRYKGVVDFRKDGREVLYRVSNPRFLEASRLIRQGLLEQIDKLRTYQDIEIGTGT